MAHVICLARSDFWHSPTIDETAHLPSGISHWELGRFELYAVNPPLMRMIAALPITFINHQADWHRFSKYIPSRSEFKVGHDFVTANGLRSMSLYTVARLALIPISVAVALLCFLWGRIESGNIAAMSVVALYCFSPTVLANASMVTPDTGAALFCAFAVFQVRSWMLRPDLSTTISCGIAFGLAWLTKFTALALFILMPVAILISGHFRDTAFVLKTLRLTCVAFIAAVAFVNAGYIFEGTGERLGSLGFVSNNLKPIDGLAEAPNRFSETAVGRLPVPFPRNFVLGIDTQKRDFEYGFRSYLMGEWKHGGWWYYYLVGFLVKEPIGFQLMLYVSILHGLYHWKRWTKHSIREWSFIVLPPLLIFGLVSSQTGFNHHMRYVLPAYPFLFIIAARTVTLGKFCKWFSYGCMTWQVVAVLWFAPHWMSYFNEAAGGPKNGHDWLVGSNIDWGQDILGLKWWQDEHPEVDLQAALFTGFDPADIGLKFRLPAPYLKGQPDVVSKDGLRGPQAGWYAVSVCQLKGHSFSVPNGNGNGNGDWVWSDGHFTYFMDHFEPVDMIGYSIYIYHITEQQAAEVREQLRGAEEVLTTEARTR